MTNADRIRNMRNEELVEFIMGVREEFINKSFYYKIISSKRFEHTDDIVVWLNSEEKRGRNYTIYACDFDGTLCESIYPGLGSPNMALINHLIKRRKQGNKVILWTCRVGDRLNEAVEWCRQYGLEFDAVNKNLPEMIEWFGTGSRKIHADIFIDDKAVNKPKYHVPYKEVVE